MKKLYLLLSVFSLTLIVACNQFTSIQREGVSSEEKPLFFLAESSPPIEETDEKKIYHLGSTTITLIPKHGGGYEKQQSDTLESFAKLKNYFAVVDTLDWAGLSYVLFTPAGHHTINFRTKKTKKEDVKSIKIIVFLWGGEGMVGGITGDVLPLYIKHDSDPVSAFSPLTQSPYIIAEWTRDRDDPKINDGDPLESSFPMKIQSDWTNGLGGQGYSIVAQYRLEIEKYPKHDDDSSDGRSNGNDDDSNSRSRSRN